MVDEGKERGRGGTRHGRREGKRGWRKRVEEGLYVCILFGRIHIRLQIVKLKK